MGEPDTKPILYGGRFAGLNREYSVEYSICSARLGCGATLEREYSWEYASARLKARLMARLKRLEYGARGQHSSSTSGARGPTVQNLQAARVDHRGLRSS